MAVFLNSVGVVLISLFSYTLWRIVKRFLIRSTLSNIPGPPRESWWAGNFRQLISHEGWEFHRDIVEKYGSVAKIHGLFGDEQLYVTDPRALHHICVKDQYIYEESATFIQANHVVFGKNLISTLGDHHRRQRKMLNPVFSVKHLRGLTDIFYSIAHELRDLLTQRIESGEEELNVLDWMSRAALEYIGQGGLGYSFEALDKSRKNPYADSVKMLIPTIQKLAILREFVTYITKIGSPAFRRMLVDWTPSKNVQEAKKIIDIMDSTSKDIYAKKEAALARGDEEVMKQVGHGKDIMSVLLRANKEASDEDKLPEDELIGQMTILIFAGQDTTSHALSRALHLLSTHQNVQDKLREEVTQARKEHGDMDYDTLMNLPYLDAVCRETLRVYAPVSYLSRITTKDIVMPLQFPIKSVDGKTLLSEIPLKKNTNIMINIDGANRSKAIWGEDAEEWKPERWLNPLPDSVTTARLPGVYSSMMTFLGGARACIGFKFAEMEMKLVLSVILESFVFSPSKTEVYWNMVPVVSPTIKGSKDQTPQLPLKVSLVQKE